MPEILTPPPLDCLEINQTYDWRLGSDRSLLHIRLRNGQGIASWWDEGDFGKCELLADGKLKIQRGS